MRALLIHRDLLPFEPTTNRLYCATELFACAGYRTLSLRAAT